MNSNTTLKSLTRDRRPPLLMDGRKDGSVHIYWPSELKVVKLKMIDDKGMTIPVPSWMQGTKAGIHDWEEKYYHVSALIMMANSGNTFSSEHANRWDAAFFLGIMWERFRKKRGAKVEITESPVDADEMDQIVKRFQT